MDAGDLPHDECILIVLNVLVSNYTALICFGFFLKFVSEQIKML